MDQVMISALGKFLNHYNYYPKLGNLSVITHDEASLGDEADLAPSDIVVYYDFSDEELWGKKEESDKFVSWMLGDNCKTNGVLEAIEIYMKHYGYNLFYEQDGSGNGLYYGILQFRKV